MHDTPAHSPSLQPRSCAKCASRKTKCDKQQPCGSCVKLQIECQYPESRRKRKSNRCEDPKDGLKRTDGFTRRKVVETASEQRTPDPHNSHVGDEDETPRANDVEESATSTASSAHPLGAKPLARLLHDQNRSKYLENGLWSRVVEELAEPGDALEDSSEDGENESDVPKDDIDFVLGLVPAPPNLLKLHPKKAYIHELWQIFRENVDPLLKIVHCPTLLPAVHKAADDISSVSKSLHALLFAIYSSAILSLQDEECQQKFNETRSALLSRYRMATKAALSQANFTGSANLALLQAFMLYLLSMREIYSSRTLWTLTGLALRIAEGMGLHRDGSFLSLPPFETEIRRRVWWQLKIIDGDLAELTGSDKFGINDTNPRKTLLPSNVDDSEIFPGSPRIPTSQDKATDMIFCSLRFDLRTYWTTSFGKQAQDGKGNRDWIGHAPGISTEEKDQLVDDFERTLESRYIRYCDPSQSIHLMATLVARTAVSTARLIAHHPRQWAGGGARMPESERQYVWDLSLRSLRQYNMILSSRNLEHFSWHASSFFRWHVFILVLDTLTVNPLVPEAAQAWSLIDEVYERNPGFATSDKKPLYVAVGNLCFKAYQARTRALATEMNPPPRLPQYMKTLASRHDAAVARRTSRETASQAHNPPDSILVKQASHTSDQQCMPSPSQQYDTQALDSTQVIPSMLQSQYTPMVSAENEQASEELFTFTNDNAHIDLDQLLAIDVSAVDTANQMIDWDKWDALLSDFS